MPALVKINGEFILAKRRLQAGLEVDPKAMNERLLASVKSKPDP